MAWIALSSSVLVGGSAWIVEEWRREDRRRRRARAQMVRRARIVRAVDGWEA